MSDTPSMREEKIHSFWDWYFTRLHVAGIGPPFERWTLIRAEQYIAAHPGRSLATHTPTDVNAWLAALGRRDDLKPWQFRQAVSALEGLFELIALADPVHRLS